MRLKVLRPTYKANSAYSDELLRALLALFETHLKKIEYKFLPGPTCSGVILLSFDSQTIADSARTTLVESVEERVRPEYAREFNEIYLLLIQDDLNYILTIDLSKENIKSSTSGHKDHIVHIFTDSRYDPCLEKVCLTNPFKQPVGEWNEVEIVWPDRLIRK